MNLLELRDGHSLCYEEYGDPAGEPILLFHGNPGSRLSWGAMPGCPFVADARLIAVDRPGYGRTDFAADALERWPQDVAELADHLGLERFNVFAPSGGAPYALACAWKIPERLGAVGSFGPVGPAHPEAVAGALRSLRLLWRIAGPLAPLIRLQMRAMAKLAARNPGKLASKLRNLELNEADQAVFDRPEIRHVFEVDLPEAYRQDGIGSAYDSAVPAAWPIPLEEIDVEIQIWRTEHDPLVGNMPGYLAKHLPRAQLYTVPTTGHLWILEHMPELLSALLGRSQHVESATKAV